MSAAAARNASRVSLWSEHVVPRITDDAAKMQKLEERFKAADKNGDGKLTKAEAEAGMPRLAKNFDSIDTDKKGYVTLDQVKAAMAAMRQSGGGNGFHPFGLACGFRGHAGAEKDRERHDRCP